jgi:hypothetical protein
MFVGPAKEIWLMIALLRRSYGLLNDLYAELEESLGGQNRRDADAACGAGPIISVMPRRIS